MKILLDMNLSPDWVEALKESGFDAIHWSSIGDPKAEDTVLMDWARSNDYILFTHDLDFGAALALTQADSPSVIQARTQDVSPGHLADSMTQVLRDNSAVLQTGALIVLDEGRSRVRVLLLKRSR
jgi:predicted nuclease of predicted toxin-antitoxin system